METVSLKRKFLRELYREMVTLRQKVNFSGRKFLSLLVALLLMLNAWPCHGGQITQAAIDAKVKDIIKYLQQTQLADGSYTYMRYRVGPTALAVLALRTAGVGKNEAVIKKAVNYIVSNQSSNTYEEGLVLLALEAVDPTANRARMKAALTFLAGGIGKQGGWGYSNTGGNDESCSQYAVLGLAAAERCGLSVSEKIKEKARDFYHRAQRRDGGWSYRQQGKSTLSMTCAGLGSLALLDERVEKVLPGCGLYMENPRLKKGLEFLGKEMPKFMQRGRSERWRYYALYALERTGIYLQMKTIGGRDWYKAGCINIMSDNNWRTDPVSASFALLFITRNEAPYAITKWQWEGDWNNDHYDVASWVKYASSYIKRPLDWQSASLSNGLGIASRSSMIFVNGHKTFDASEQELKAIRQYLDMGGVLIAEACCDRRRFADSFKQVMAKKLYPGKKLEFKKLGSNHSILSNVYKFSSETAGVWVLGRGCSRKPVFLLTRDISCAFNGDESDATRVKFARALGLNIVLYALGKRKPQKKFSKIDIRKDAMLDLLSAKAKEGKGAVFKYENPFGRIKFRGEWTTDPNFYTNLQVLLKKYPGLPFFDGEVVIDPETSDVYGCPVLWISGHGEPKLSKRAVLNLRRYVQNGGFIMAEACCADTDFDKGIRELLKLMFPNRALQRVSRKDAIYRMPFNIDSQPCEGTTAYKRLHKDKWPNLYGIADGDRWAFIYCPVDYSCAVDGDLEEDIEGLKLKSAFPLIANMLTAGLRIADQAEEKETQPERK